MGVHKKYKEIQEERKSISCIENNTKKKKDRKIDKGENVKKEREKMKKGEKARIIKRERRKRKDREKENEERREKRKGETMSVGETTYHSEKL